MTLGDVIKANPRVFAKLGGFMVAMAAVPITAYKLIQREGVFNNNMAKQETVGLIAAVLLVNLIIALYVLMAFVWERPDSPPASGEPKQDLPARPATTAAFAGAMDTDDIPSADDAPASPGRSDIVNTNDTNSKINNRSGARGCDSALPPDSDTDASTTIGGTAEPQLNDKHNTKESAGARRRRRKRRE